MTRSIFILFSVFAFCFVAQAQEHFSNGLAGADIQKTAVISLEDQYYDCDSNSSINCPYDFSYVSTKLYTRLYFDESQGNYFSSPWTFTIEYDIKLYTTASASSPAQVERGKTLTIDYDPTNNYKDIDLEVFPAPTGSGAIYTKAEVNITDVTSTLPGVIPNDIHFDTHLEVERVYHLDPAEAPTISPNGIFNATKNTLTVYWSFLPGAEEYELWWWFVDRAHKNPSDPIIMNNASPVRITTQQHFYDIPLAYSEGIVFFTVRGIGKEQSNPLSTDFDKRIEGSTAFPGSYEWQGLEQDKNWQYNAVYAEEGKRKEVINFYDGILKPIQTATILNTDQTAVVAEPVYDYIGRNSLQVLPAPQESQGIRFYGPLHKKDNLGNPYSYKDFDLDGNLMTPSPLSAMGNLGAGHYYSDQNDNPMGINGVYTPDAEGYPFSRTIYKNDGSGRATRISGVGKEYFGGGASGDEIQHDTRFLYGTPFQEELFRLFGNNVGFAQYYEKTVTIDPNGQASTAITDLSGRVIATALAGDAPDNLYDIDTKPDTFDVITVDLARLNELSIQDESLTVNKVLLAVGPTTFDFDYSINPDVFTNCDVSQDCVYDLEIYLLDEYGRKMELSYNGSTHNSIEIQSISSSISLVFSASVQAGSYQLVKKLTLNEEALNKAVQKWKDEQTCYQPEEITPIDTCNPDCEELCEESYKTPVDVNGIQYYIDDEGTRVAKIENDGITITVLDQAAYDDVLDAIADCQTQCESFDPMPDPCELMYETLKADVSPGGQYFDNLPDRYLSDGVTLNTAYDRNGWLLNLTLDTSTLNCLRFAVGYHYIPGDRNFSWNDLWDTVRANWNPDIADVLVQYHPEWCAFEKLCGPKDVKCDYTDTSWGVTVTNRPYNDLLTQADYDRIDAYIDATDFVSASNQALGALDTPVDPAIAAEFTPAKLEERARKYYEESIKYCKVKDACDGLYLEAAEDLGTTTADGFTIRYPKVDMQECFCDAYPENDPETFFTALSDCATTLVEDTCEDYAQMTADRFLQNIKDKCDVLTVAQENALWQHVYDETLASCEDESYTVDINESIRDFAECNGLPEACIVEALPEEEESSCECAAINNFVYDVIRETPRGEITVGGVTRDKTFMEILTEAGIENDQAIIDALNIALDPDDLHLVSNFSQWFKACQEDPFAWNGTSPTPPAELAEYFKCDDDLFEDDDYDADEDCVTIINDMMQQQAELAYQALIAQKAAEYRQAYINHCLTTAANGREQFKMKYEYKEYHYTLYYYDQADNLVATVPPEGLYQKDPITGAVHHNSLINNSATHNSAWNYLTGASSAFVHTNHQMITNYKHNSLQNVVKQHTPDGGETEFWYDALGRLAVSQNAEQQTGDRYSYLQYDVLGRTIAAGELLSSNPMDDAIAGDTEDFNIPGGNNDLLNWIDNGTVQEATYSFYDVAEPTVVTAGHPAENKQHNLRNRISAVAVDEDGDGTYEALTHYTYDALGNVNTLWQENRAIPLPNHRVKQMDYDYDLVSGNVNQVTYQPGEVDQFIHRYAYDADNRITEVKTSTDGIIWDADARYFYYAHGPLAREEIGDKHIFGNDYVYTLQGWMTGMNSSILDPKFDAGKDGNTTGLNRHFGRDPFAFSLHYFNDHYKPIVGGVNNVLATKFGSIDQNRPIDVADTKPLYNGNISKMVTSLKDLAEKPIPAMANAYKYDQLNRIKTFTPFWDATGNDPLSSNNFDNVRNEGKYYNSRYWFDGNGNIARLQRNGIKDGTTDFTQMDFMDYGYYTTGNVKHNNKLSFVKDHETTPGFDLDIESGQTAGNYQYDAIGRLVTDRQENISRINWNVSNKVKEVNQSDANPNLAFGYGPMGNRITKWVKAKTGTTPDPTKDTKTFYVLDAQGNPLAVYKWDASTNAFKLLDFTLYGTKRLGTSRMDKEMH